MTDDKKRNAEVIEVNDVAEEEQNIKLGGFFAFKQ